MRNRLSQEFAKNQNAAGTWARIAELSERGFRTDPKGRISEVRRRATAELDHREAEFHDWVEGHALAAWIRATEDLLTLDRPPAFICTQESPGRH